VSDIFGEVDEEVRRERLKRLWDRYGLVVIGLAVLLVAAVAGYRIYESMEAKKAATAGAAFESAVALETDGKHDEAEAAFAKLATEGTGSYRVLAKLRAASEIARRDPKAGIAAYGALADDGTLTQTQRDYAGLRAGLIAVDTASYDEVRNRLEPLTAAARPFRHSARSVLALAAWKAKDTAAMQRWIEQITTDPESPSGIRGQAEMLSALTPADAKS
jgi:hypothetical protein